MGILIYFCKITNMQAFTIDANQLQNLIAKINNQHGHRDITLDHAQNSGDHSVLNVAQSSMDNRYGSNNVKMGEFTNDGNYAVTNIGLQNLVTVNNDNGQRNIELENAQTMETMLSPILVFRTFGGITHIKLLKLSTTSMVTETSSLTTLKTQETTAC